jgi:hypothetical protein
MEKSKETWHRPPVLMSLCGVTCTGLECGIYGGRACWPDGPRLLIESNCIDLDEVTLDIGELLDQHAIVGGLHVQHVLLEFVYSSPSFRRP